MTNTPAPRTWALSPGRAVALPGVFIVALALFGIFNVRQHAVMLASVLGAAAAAAVWAAVLYAKARGGSPTGCDFRIRRWHKR